jgi:PAS domain S-box-containing protein
MEDEEKTKEQLLKELLELRQRIAELETLEVKRKQTEDALRESEDKYRTIFETTGTATIIIKEDTTISLANTEFERLSGYSLEEVEGKKSWTDFVANKDDLERMKAYHNDRRIDPGAAPRNYEYKFIDKKGTVKDIFSTIAVIPGTKKSVGSFLNITERKQTEKALQKSEEQLRFLSYQLLEAQEKERKRIAHELHDGIGQILSAIKFGLEDTINRMGNHTDTESNKALENIIPMIQNGIEEIRRICMNLRPSILDDLGILATISWFCRDFQRIYSGIRIEQQIDIQENDVPDILTTVIYRVLQEALNNIAKHSQADVVHLSIRKRDKNIELCIKDNGMGFDLVDSRSKESPKRGLGLASMKERTEYSGGSLDIKSGRSTGTIILASWPCQ